MASKKDIVIQSKERKELAELTVRAREEVARVKQQLIEVKLVLEATLSAEYNYYLATVPQRRRSF